jgi:hypothetical protein
MQTK